MKDIDYPGDPRIDEAMLERLLRGTGEFAALPIAHRLVIPPRGTGESPAVSFESPARGGSFLELD